jgi:hypothetical protein
MKNKRFAIVVLAMVVVLALPLVSSADEFWNFFYPQSPFPNASSVPALSVAAVGATTVVTNGNGFSVSLTPYADAAAGPFTGGQLDTRLGIDENGVGVGPGPYVEGVSDGYEVNGNEAIKIVFNDFENIPGAASEHLYFNSLEGGDVAYIWKNAPFVQGNLLGTIDESVLPEPHNFTIPASAFGHDIYVTSNPNSPALDILLNGASIDTVAVAGCTLTFGYWKTHSIYGPAAHPDPTWNEISPNGPNTIFFLSSQSYLQVLQTSPKGGNAYYILAHQYIAAVLNQLKGASSIPEVDASLAEALAFFNTYTPSSTLSTAMRNEAISNANILDQYNEGIIGPGHCSTTVESTSEAQTQTQSNQEVKTMTDNPDVIDKGKSQQKHNLIKR